MANNEVQVMFGDSRLTVVTEQPQALFRVLRALIEAGHDPQIRYHDPELRDFTFWQPAFKVA